MNIWIAIGAGFLGMMVIAVMSYSLVKQFLDGEHQRRIDAAEEAKASRLQELKKADQTALVPLRLQAYERAVLFLDRINPGELVLRVHKSHMDARTLHRELLTTIKEEYGHNVSQQLYMSEDAWARVRQASEETKRLMNVAMEKTGDKSTGVEFSRAVFETMGQLPHTPSQVAIQFLRKEFQQLFS